MAATLSMRLNGLCRRVDETMDADTEQPATFLVDAPDDVRALLREAADLARRWEAGVRGEAIACNFEDERPVWQIMDDREAVPLTLRGRVRIVPEVEP